MIKITLATSNPDKIKEINEINTNKNIIFEAVKGAFNPDETGKTFEENALIKAREAAKTAKTYCLADDSGLCCDALEGKPGIYSSRYAETPEKRIEKLLTEMKGLSYDDRSAHFICSMVLVNAEGKVLHTETGRVFGYINDRAQGKNGFGYDPVFLLPAYDKTIAELDEAEKNKISHRSAALRPMLKWIEENL